MKTQGIGPVFQVNNLTDALKYYKEVLGFKEDFQFGDYAGVSHGDACVHLCAHVIHRRPVGGGSAFVFCDEVDDYCQEIKKNGAVIKVEPADQPYGMRDFIVLDPDGNHMTFGCEIRDADQ
ncbi:MAG: VOC family protein [Verrucomicrobia bacterium]|nr:VOC family protein [Verrucomicrobiota bacterium]